MGKRSQGHRPSQEPQKPACRYSIRGEVWNSGMGKERCGEERVRHLEGRKRRRH
jgi:hypothetical protein